MAAAMGIAALVVGAAGPVHAATAATPTVRVATVLTEQSPGGPVTAIVPIVLDGPATTTVTAHWLTHTPSTTYPATAGRDYTAAAGTVTFLPGEVQHDVKIKIHKGNVTGPYKDFGVYVDQVTGAAGVNSSGLVRLTAPNGDDVIDGSRVVFAPESPARGTGYTATVTFVLRAPLANDVTAHYSEQPDSDATSAFYVAKSGTLRIASGKVTTSIKVRMRRPPIDNGVHNLWIALDSLTGISGPAGDGGVEVR